MADGTLAKMFWSRVEKSGDRPAQMFKQNGVWKTLTWREVGETVREVALGLIALGRQKGDAIALLSSSRAEWVQADFAIFSAGCITVPVYPSYPPDLIAYVVEAAKDADGETAQVVPGTPERGEKLFAERQCVACHSVGGKGAKVGPDLGRSGHHVSLTRFGALMWNHGPAMWAKMRERSIEVPTLAGQDMADILAYLYVSRYFDRAASRARGQTLIQGKGCTACHAVRGKGGKLAADFATSSVVGSPASLIAGMWNHAVYMEAKAQTQDIAWPALKGQELADIAAYLTSLGKPGAPKSRPK